MQITLEQLMVLEAIAETGSFSGAARVLHRATSAVSYAIKGLEQALGGAQVFDRSGYRAQLTEIGRVVLEEGCELLARGRRLEHLVAQLQQGWEPQLRVVVDGVLPMPPLVRAIREFSGRRVPTKVRLMVEYLSGVVERFERDEAELMLAIAIRPDPTWSKLPLPAVEMVLLAHRDHALHELAQPRSRAALCEHVEVLVNDSAVDLAPTPRSNPHVVGSPQVFQLADFYAKREALRAGLGFGWLPRHLADELIKAGELAPVGFVEGDHQVLQPHLIHRRSQPLGRGAQLFLEVLGHELGTALTKPGA